MCAGYSFRHCTKIKAFNSQNAAREVSFHSSIFTRMSVGSWNFGTCLVSNPDPPATPCYLHFPLRPIRCGFSSAHMTGAEESGGRGAGRNMASEVAVEIAHREWRAALGDSWKTLIIVQLAFNIFLLVPQNCIWHRRSEVLLLLRSSGEGIVITVITTNI